MPAKKKPLNVAWAFWANMYGPWYDKPHRVTANDNDMVDGWWDEDGDSYVCAMGLDDSRDGRGYLSYASADKRDVELFILGFNAARKLMRNFVGEK